MDRWTTLGLRPGDLAGRERGGTVCLATPAAAARLHTDADSMKLRRSSAGAAWARKRSMHDTDLQ